MNALVIFAAVVAALAIAALAWACSPRQQAERERWRLHLELAAASGLSRDQLRLLWRLARRAGLAEPLHVWVRPSAFDAAAAAGPAGPGVAELRARLFGV